MRAQLSVMRARATSLLLTTLALAFVLAAPVVAASSMDVTSTNAGDVGPLGRLADDPSVAASQDKLFRRTGIDVSHWQGSIDWPRVAASGIDFAVIKATQGSDYVDPWYLRNRTRARAAGILVTAYHFAAPGLAGRGTRQERITRDARIEARHFLRTARLGPDDLIPALDLERSGGLPPSELRFWAMTFLRTVTDSVGARPMVYSNADFWRTHMADTTRVARAGFRFWVAHWDTRTPEVPGRWWLGRGWTFWQWTDCGRVPGIEGCVDRNTYLSSRALRNLRISHQQQQLAG